MRKLSLDHRGYPVPWFVAWIDGKPDFRVIRPDGVNEALRFARCWLCGETLGAMKTFVIGPMCAVNRVTSEPPCHHDCATFAALACPFMILPAAKRRDSTLPEGTKDPAGHFLKRNPGAVCLWTVRAFRRFAVQGGMLIDVGEPERVEWFAYGRPATRAEVMESIDSGLHHLWSMARAQHIDAAVALENQYAKMLPLLPAEEPLKAA